MSSRALEANETDASREEGAAVPWPLVVSSLGITSAMIGAHWDISWHRSIGRDSFWTAPHVAIQLCGVLAGIACGYLILATTFGTSARSLELRDTSVSIWGFRAPIGAFLAAWGGITMIVSAPWDDWWHSAYGLDVKIISPPHVLLILGMLGVEAGVLLLVLGERNRAAEAGRGALTLLALYVGGLVVVQLLVFLMEYIDRSAMHQSFFYRYVSALIPLALAMLSRATGHRWAATIAVAVYSALALLLLWILPLFPAQPKLGPVFHEVTHMIPFEFPLLLVVPALLLDLLFAKKSDWGAWKLSAAAGVLFVASFLAVQWPFGDFLQSPAARNAFFGAHYMGYYTQPTWRFARFLFDPPEAAPAFARGMALAVAFAILSTRLGLAAGGWMRRVTR